MGLWGLGFRVSSLGSRKSFLAQAEARLPLVSPKSLGLGVYGLGFLDTVVNKQPYAMRLGTQNERTWDKRVLLGFLNDLGL